jgi:hypothetical protein
MFWGSLLNSLTFFTIIGYGAISYAPNLDKVAHRRIAYHWQLASIEGYDVLVAPADCALLGRHGWLIVGDRFYRAMVVDCEADTDKGEMAKRRLLLDQNLKELVHKRGWLILQ